MQLTTTNRSGFAPTTITEAMEFSKMLAESSMVPRAYQGKPQDIMVCVQWGYELGLAPMQALQNIAVINGKPSVYGDAMMALVQASPLCEGIDEHIEGEGTANPVAVCIAKRKGRNPVIARFSVEDAKRAGLWGKQGPWQAYPKRMLAMRARGFALRDAFPDVLKGLITAEEAQDYPEEAKPRPAKDITPIPANPLDMIAPPAPPPSKMDDVVEGVKKIMREQPTEDLIAAGEQFFNAVMAGQSDDEAPAPTTEPPQQTKSSVVDEYVPDLDDAPEAPPEPPAAPANGFQLLTPGKDGEPPNVHATFSDLSEWADKFVELMDKTGRAGQVPPRQRMTVLRQFRELNEATIQMVDITKKTAIIAMYGQRLRGLGAQLTEDEK